MRTNPWLRVFACGVAVAVGSQYEVQYAESADDPAAEADTWTALLALVRDDLAISKPGHDGWQGD